VTRWGESSFSNPLEGFGDDLPRFLAEEVHHLSFAVEAHHPAGDPLYTLLLLGLGLTVFSMNGPDVPEVKKIIRSTTLEHAKQIARRVMSFDSERQVMHFLREETRKIIPEAF